MSEELFSRELTSEEEAAQDFYSLDEQKSNETDGAFAPSEANQKVDFQAHEDDVMRIRDSIPERKKIAYEKELRLRKIIAQLQFTGYSQEQIYQILGKFADKELFDDIVKQYNLRGIPDPDMSDLCW